MKKELKIGMKCTITKQDLFDRIRDLELDILYLKNEIESLKLENRDLKVMIENNKRWRNEGKNTYT